MRWEHPERRCRTPRRPGSRAGLTLIEVLAASMILGIGLVGVGSLVTYGVVSHRKSVNYTVAAARTVREIERIREAGYLSAEIGPDLFPSPAYTILSSTQVGFPVAELKGGQGSITVIEDPEAQALDPDTGLPYLNLKQVSVHITWGGTSTLAGSYSAATLIANRP